MPVIDANENKDIIEKYKRMGSIKNREVFHRFYDNLINQDENEKYSEYFASNDFDDYWDAYIKFTDYMLGEFNNTKIQYRWYYEYVCKKFSTWAADNYYDWHKQVNAGIGDLWDDFFEWTGFSCIFSLALVLGFGGISPFVWYISFAVGFKAAAAMGYAYNGVNNFQRLRNREVDIIIHVVNETGVGIPDLHNSMGGILAQNKNAIDKCVGEGGKGAFDTQKFKYKMKPIQGNTSEEGWYSLSNRYEFDEDEKSAVKKYEQAVCPPGLWNITIDGGDIYKKREIPEFNVLTADVVILDNITLDFM
jgi:hypothetical protein